MSAALLNSGIVGLGAVDVVGLGDVEVLVESDMTEIVLSSKLVTKSSPLLESYATP